MAGELGKASLDLEANLAPFEKNMAAAKRTGDDMQHSLDALAAVAKISEDALNRVKMSQAQGAESRVSAESILSGVRGISEEARTAARELDNVKIGSAQAAESAASGDVIDRSLKKITGNANEARRSLESMRLAGAGAGGTGGRSGVGVGAFGSGYGRIGLVGAAIGVGALTGPAAAPAAVGLLAAIPALAAGAAGALGTVALAFQGVGKAIGGDYKAFQQLVPAQQAFVQQVRSLDGWLDKLKQTAAGSMFPGLTEALHSALSPGTLGAATQAVTEFGRAIGQAGAAWGRYFGSPEFQQIFGPLMAAGARNLGLLSDAALRLFDAVGVLGRAAIPLTSWIVTMVDRGSQLADTWLRAQDASGGLSRALDEAQTSLRLVGGLAESLLRAVGALGDALYPVAKIAVKDLTDGLNALAGIIERNKGVIRDIISSALAGLVTAVKGASDGLKLLTDGLEHVVGQKAPTVTAILAIGAAITLAMGPESAAIVGAIVAIGLIAKHWETVKTWLEKFGAWEVIFADKVALAMVDPFSHLPSVLGGWARKAKDAITSQLDSARADLKTIGQNSGTAYGEGLTAGIAAALRNAGAAMVGSSGSMYLPKNGGRGLPADSGTMLPGQIVSPGMGGHYSAADLAALWIKAGGDPSIAPLMAQIALSESSGNPAAHNPSGATGLWQILGQITPGNLTDPLVNAQNAVAKYSSQGLGAWDASKPAWSRTAAYQQYLAGGLSMGSPFGTPPPFTKNVPKPTVTAGANLLPAGLLAALDQAKLKVSDSQGATAEKWLKVELSDLEAARKDLEKKLGPGVSAKQKAAINAEIRSIDDSIAGVNRGITANLKAQAAAVKQQFQQRISTATGAVSSAFSTLKQALDAQFEAATQAYIDTTIAPKFFQGTDSSGAPLQTPLEKQLADMQAADQLKQLQDAVTAATDPASRAAAQRQLDEYQLGIEATKERQQADHDYADAVKKYQAERSETERQLNLQLDTFGNGLANGTTKLSGLGQIVSGFGLSLVADGGIVSDFAALQTATQALGQVYLDEAAKLRGVGDNKDANSAFGKGSTLTGGGGAPGSGSNLFGTLDPGIAATLGIASGPAASSALGGAAGFFMLNPIHKMAAGGIGTVRVPTLFLAGDAGREDFAFSGGGRSFAAAAAAPVVNVTGFVGNEAELAVQIGRVLQTANRRGIKFGIE